MKKILIILAVFTALFSSGCKFSKERPNNEADRQEAEKVVNTFYQLITDKKIDEARRLFHPYLLLNNDSVKFRAFLDNMSLQSAALKERKLDHWQTNIITGLNAGAFYALYYVNKYADGSEMKVSIILQNDDSNHIRIFNFQIAPDKFR